MPTFTVDKNDLKIDGKSIRFLNQANEIKGFVENISYKKIDEERASFIINDVVFCSFIYSLVLVYKKGVLDYVELQTTYSEYIKAVPQEEYFNPFAAFNYTLPKVIGALKNEYGEPKIEYDIWRSKKEIKKYVFDSGEYCIEVLFGRDGDQIIIAVNPRQAG
jgi:hypothetical protein